MCTLFALSKRKDKFPFTVKVVMIFNLLYWVFSGSGSFVCESNCWADVAHFELPWCANSLDHFFRHILRGNIPMKFNSIKLLYMTKNINKQFRVWRCTKRNRNMNNNWVDSVVIKYSIQYSRAMRKNALRAINFMPRHKIIWKLALIN